MCKVLKSVLFFSFVAFLMVSCNKEKEIAVTSVTIGQATAEMYIGETTQLTATVLPSDATNKTVSWASSKQSVTTVSSTGLVTAVAEGTSTITASAGGKSGTCTVTVSKKAIVVSSVELNKTTMELTVGDSETLTTTVKPDDATDKTVTWSTSDAAIATVDNGKVTAVKEGEANITAKAGDKTATCKVTVTKKVIPVTDVTLDHETLELMEGEEAILVATIEPENATNKAATWSSSNAEVATVDNAGKVTAVKEGSATITTKTEDGGKTASCSITIKSNVATSVTVGADHISVIGAVLSGKANLKNSAASDLKVGFQYSKSAGILPSNSYEVDAEDADANYNYTTRITGLEQGATYYYRSFVRQNGKDEYGETKEFKTKEIESLIETLDASEVGAGKATLNAKLDLTDVSYYHNSIKYGFYFGISEDDMSGPYDASNLSGQSFSKALNTSHNTKYWYKAYVFFEAGVSGSYSTYKYSFYGNVKTFKTGTVPVESVSLDKTEYTFDTIGSSLTLKATVLPSDATDKSVEWSSDKLDVATVDQTGKVKAIGNGTATITVSTKDQAKTAKCVITVAHKPYTAIAGEAVDLGLSVKWSSWNLGATKPEEYGDYFAWGEIEPHYSSLNPITWKDGKTGYDWASYKWCNGSSTTLTKYNTDPSCGTVDNKTDFKDYNYEDDAARAALGGTWRIPTRVEMFDLHNKCTWTWTTNYKGTGVAGMIVTSNVDGFRDKSIFLPATGLYDATTFRESGSYGNYWTSSIDASIFPVSYAWFWWFDSKHPATAGAERFYGFPIRPVSE